MSFFTFPLCLLAMPQSEKERLQVIIGHSMARAGRGAGARELGHDRIVSTVMQWKNEGCCQDYDSSNKHNDLVRGAILCGVRPGSFRATFAQCKEGDKFIDSHETEYGKCPLVFIATQLLWDCHDRGNPDFRQFSVLCGVNSIIGQNTRPVLIRRSMLIARQLGYKTPAVMHAALRPDQMRLTVKQLRSVLDSLENRNLIYRSVDKRRNVYFSTRLNHDELRQAVKHIRESKDKIKIQRELDRAAQNPQASHLPSEPKEKGPLKKGIRRTWDAQK